MLRFSALLCVLGMLVSACESTPKDPSSLKINQIQLIGSHNSYKKPIEEPLLDMIAMQDSTLAYSLDYRHAPLKDQLDLRLRQLELDVFHDPEGGRYTDPLGNLLLKSKGIKPLLYNRNDELSAKGMKVFHIQDIDFRSHCLIFQDCLENILDWSKENRGHLPVVITLNLKESGISRAGFNFTQPLAFGAAAMDSLDQEILEVFGKERLIVPDDIRGTYQTLEEAVLAQNWPNLDKARNKFLFVLDAAPEGRQISTYLEGHPSLTGRLLFVNSRPGKPHSAFMIMNNPTKDQAAIQQNVRKGYLVRTRADAGTKEARVGDFSRYRAARSSGAQFISTDYYIPDPRFPSNYRIEAPEGGAWCNPLFEIESCDGFEFE
ncbi:MAG: phosphatidylinositol-specific phospholipase C1-like protein [Bacteroidota bacterium]